MVSRGLLGKKVGMTQMFDADGNIIPITVIETGPCIVLNNVEPATKKVKLGFESIKEKRLRKPDLGFFKKIAVSPLRYIKEFDLIEDPNPERGVPKDNQDKGEDKQAGKDEAKTNDAKADEKKDDAKADTKVSGEYTVGTEIKADLFRAGDFVDVSGKSIGKGFQGGMKRWNWDGGPSGHGSMHHRRVGSIGASADPSRTFRGRHMPGQMGSKNVTVQNLRVMEVDPANNLILIDGTVPGKNNSYVAINLSKKRQYKSLTEKTVVHAVKRNPMKQSKSKAKGK